MQSWPRLAQQKLEKIPKEPIDIESLGKFSAAILQLIKQRENLVQSFVLLFPMF